MRYIYRERKRGREIERGKEIESGREEEKKREGKKEKLMKECQRYIIYIYNLLYI